MSDTVIDGIDYGPLAGLAGTWFGDKGMDVSPEPEGQAENPYFETILFETIGEVTNVETQRLAALRYLQVVSRKSDRKVFHNEVGFWMWDSAADVVMQSLAIPRGVCVIARGKATLQSTATVLEVSATLDGPWGIVQTPFMHARARTVAFRHSITLSADTLDYAEITELVIYDRRFEHTDRNTLHRKA